MYNPRPIPVLTGENAERFEQMRMDAERSDAPRYDLSTAKAAFAKIMSRSATKAK